MSQSAESFEHDFRSLTGFTPFKWQRRLFDLLCAGKIPSTLDLPTGLGKTSTMVLWLLARAYGSDLPRRLIYVVDRRVVVDQATEEAERLRANLDQSPELKRRLGMDDEDRLAISTLRGSHHDNREWLMDPSAPAIIVGTIDMIGSRLLFSGYGVSHRMRPYHAGLLGADSLVLLDEAHLVPPFESLLASIENGAQKFGTRKKSGQAVIPRLRALSLSATGRSRNGDAFRLTDGDIPDVAQRIYARKHLAFSDARDKDLAQALTEQAWQVAAEGMPGIRCIVYCDSRLVAEKVEKSLRAKAASGRKGDQPANPHATQLLVGARRAFERDAAKDWLAKFGFLAGSPPPDCAAFLVATSAGEVGIDLDADHMVCDLVPWERMVQRLGRVNRRGGGDARIVVVDQGEPRLKDPDSPAPSEQRAAIAWRARSVLAYLPRSDAGLSASPDALRDLKRRAEADPDLQELITAASTPSPLRPVLTRPLVDAWAMTSIDAHTGRPEVAPWLRGWIDEEEPQTAIVWRASLPIRSEEPAAIEEIETFFEAAPPHASEILETETWRVVEWLMERARRTSGVSSADRLPRDRIVTIALTSSRQIIRARDGRPLTLTLSDLAPTKEQTARKAQQLARALAGATIIVDALMGGLDPSGMLDASSDVIPLTADTPGSAWPQSEDTGRPIVGFILHPDQPVDDVIIEASDIVIFATRRSEDGQVQRAHLIETWTTEESRAAASRAQLLDEHESWAAEEADRLARRLGLEKDIAHALVAAARLHDEGKRAQRWQRSFNAPSNGIYAKTKGPLNTVHLDGYRHEFGSIPHTAASPLVTALADPDLRDLVLHLVAAHHGFARPSITARGCEDGPPSALQVRAQQVALRFVRLQKQWGPWGLAWLEALLRAADQRASRRNDKQAGSRHG